MIVRMKKTAQQCAARFQECFPEYKKPFLSLFLFYLLAFSSIFRADFTYWDDIGRTYAGYHGWLDWSRYGTEALATLLHGGWHLTDISPLPQILACGVMAAAGILLLLVFGEGKKIGFWQLIAVSLTTLAPYFLGMISYKFDSPYMALSFLASVVPFLFREKPWKVYGGVSVFCLLVMCTTYQASSGIYPMIALFLAAQSAAAGKRLRECLRFLGLSAAWDLTALIVFWLFLMRDNGVSVFSASELIPLSIKRYVGYYRAIFHDFNQLWLLLCILLLLLFLCAVCVGAKINRLAAAGLGLLMILGGSVLCFGANLFISREAFHARSMYGFNVFLALLAVFIAFHLKPWAPKAIYGALVWCFFVFALTYGNALARQQEYRDLRLQLLLADLQDLEAMRTEEEKEVRILGNIGYSPVIARMAEDYPIFSREASGLGDDLICSGLGEDIWGSYYFYHYLNLPHVTGPSGEEGWEGLPVLRDGMYHRILGSGSKIAIELK